MRILSTGPEDLALAAKAIRDGLLVAIPTETVYGLGANAWDTRALARVFAAKDRPSFDPLIIHVARPEAAEEVAELDALYVRAFMERFWPGPLTLVLPKKDCVPDLATSGLATVAVRCPAHPVAREIIRLAGVPVAAPSANPFGRLSPTKAAHVAAFLGDRVDYIVDGGSCAVGVESTVLDLSERPPLVLRPGGISLELLRELAPGVELFDRVSSSPRAPGQLPSHYAPRRPLRVAGAGRLHEAQPSGRAAALCFGEEARRRCEERGVFARVVDLSPGRDPIEAAAALFDRLHSLDLGDWDELWAERLPEEGLGRAVNDRLNKAAAKGSS